MLTCIYATGTVPGDASSSTPVNAFLLAAVNEKLFSSSTLGSVSKRGLIALILEMKAMGLVEHSSPPDEADEDEKVNLTSAGMRQAESYMGVR